MFSEKGISNTLQNVRFVEQSVDDIVQMNPPWYKVWVRNSITIYYVCCMRIAHGRNKIFVLLKLLPSRVYGRTRSAGPHSKRLTVAEIN